MDQYTSLSEGLNHPECDLRLFSIHQVLRRLGQSGTFFNLLLYQHMWEPINRNQSIATKLDYTPAQKAVLQDQCYAQLNMQ